MWGWIISDFVMTEGRKKKIQCFFINAEAFFSFDLVAEEAFNYQRLELCSGNRGRKKKSNNFMYYSFAPSSSSVARAAAVFAAHVSPPRRLLR